MPRRRDISFTLALCLSLTVHGWVLYLAAQDYVAGWTRLLLPPLTKVEPIGVTAAPPPPAPPMRVIDRMDQLGDDASAGEALASAEGDERQQARKSFQEQALLSLDPAGTGGVDAARPEPPSPPAFDVATQADSGAPKFAVPSAVAAPPLQPLAVAPSPGTALAQNDTKTTEDMQDQADSQTNHEPQDNLPVDRTHPPDAPAEQHDAPPPPKDRPLNRLPQEALPQLAQRPSPPADAELPGDPAPLAESESDAFSTQDSVEFRRGKTVARLGRKHKLVSPRLEMVAYADLMTMRPPVRIVLRLYIDVTGNVVKADIVKSSGSINLDVPTKQAAYKWWFEPRKDTRGQPLSSEVFEFVVGFS